MRTCQIDSRERCDCPGTMTGRRRFLFVATAIREFGIPPIARAARLVGACGLFVVLSAPPALATGPSSDAREPIQREGVDPATLSRAVIDVNEFYGLSASPFDAALPSASTGGVAGPAGVDLALGGTNETTVVVNPRNTHNVAAASLHQLRVSMDGGVTFQAGVGTVVEANHVQCGDPSVAFDNQGRLFWSYLGCVLDGPNLFGIDVYIARSDPSTGAIMGGYPVNVTASPAVGRPANGGFLNDKEWLVADSWPSSPFVDRLYLAWTEFVGGGTIVWASFSADQGLTWSAPVMMSGTGEGFVWPCHNAVAPNGDIYVAYHSQPGFAGGGYPNGVSGQIFILRSVNGGVAYPQKTLAYGPGLADMTFNVQHIGGAIPQTDFWLQGSVQPWVLPDPRQIGRVHLVANDDPDNNPLAGDPANVYIATSSDDGLTWGAPVRIDGGLGTTFQVMPTAAIDRDSGCIAVHYSDNRAGVKNSGGNYLLDVFYTVSQDQGVTFLPDVQFNDVAFDPDLGAPIRFPGPPATRRIGEYNGIAFDEGDIHGVWCGNTAVGQQTIYDKVPDACAVGACCAVADNQCTQHTEAQCEALGNGFTYRGNGTPCGLDGTCIPTVSEWGLLVLAMLLLCAGAIRIGRRLPIRASREA